MLSKDHSEHCDKTQNLVQVDKSKHIHRLKKTFVKNKHSGNGTFGDLNNTEFLSAIQTAQGWKKKYTSIEDIPNEVVPNEYDFRNINGYDFTSKLRDQGGCGSCYTMGFI